MSLFEIPSNSRISQRQKIQRLLSNLMQARLEMKIAKIESTADPRLDKFVKHEQAMAIALALQSEAERLIARLGTASERARLQAILRLR